MSAAYNMELTLAMCTPFRCILWDRLRQVGASTVTVLLPCCPYVLVPGSSACCCCLTRDKRCRRRLTDDFLGRSDPNSGYSSTGYASPAYGSVDRRTRRCSSTSSLPGQSSDKKQISEGYGSLPVATTSAATLTSRRASSPALSSNASCSHGDESHVEVSHKHV